MRERIQRTTEIIVEQELKGALRAAHRQRAGADQGGVPAPDQDPGLAAEPGSGLAVAVRAVLQRPDKAAPPGRLARTRVRWQIGGGCVVG